MNRHRRDVVRAALCAAALPALPRLALSQAAAPQTYPTHPVRFIVPFAPGSAPDIIARLIGQWLNDLLGQPFVVDNRPGAGSNIGTEAAVRSTPDGYTVVMTVLTNVFNTTLYRNLSFNFINDIVHVAGVANAPYVMIVPPSFPAKTIPDSSPTPKPIPARSTSPPAARARRPISSANCSRSWPASTWSTCRIAAST